MREVLVAATQKSCTEDSQQNIESAEAIVREAHAKGAQIILLQELFENLYFCKDQHQKHFSLARPFDGHSLIAHFSKLAKELSVVLPISYFERAGNAFFNSLCVIDADGSILDNYRKAHIPNGPGYQEKHYFSPGDTGFKVWDTRYGRIGVAICWDQWFPEAARIMALQGAELLFYPTAIGSEPQDESLDSSDHWQNTMCGHAAANVVPVIASNRIGREVGESCDINFYGSSFISDETGNKVEQASRTDEAILIRRFDLDAIAEKREAWGLFRDRRPELYAPICGYDGD